MRRAGGLWDGIVAFDALAAAAKRAARGKRDVRSVASFVERLEPEVLSLQRELIAGTWRPGRPHTFKVRDPKERTITAAPFRDRVVHHALMDRLEPFFERRMVYESFACRKGKGTHRALRHARQMLRRHDWFLKLDIQGFFPSLHHPVVMETVAHVIKDRRVHGLCETLLRGPPGDRESGESKEIGLPIGNLSSQWFANLVLDRLDHFVKETLRVPGYVRYMDDFVLFGDSKRALGDARIEVEHYVGQRLRLRLKEGATLLGPHHVGLPFLGFRIYRGNVRVRPDNLRRLRKKLHQRRRQHDSGAIDEAAYARSLRSVMEHLTHGDTLGLRRALFAAEGFP